MQVGSAQSEIRSAAILCACIWILTRIRSFRTVNLRLAAAALLGNEQHGDRVVKGKTVEEALKITNRAVMEALQTGFRRLRSIVPCLQRRQFIRHCGIMRRRTG